MVRLAAVIGVLVLVLIVLASRLYWLAKNRKNLFKVKQEKRVNKRMLKNSAVALVFLALICFSTVTQAFGLYDDTELIGVTETDEPLTLSAASYLSGQFQEYFDAWYADNFNYHNVSFKAYNQLRQDLFRRNNSVVFGKNGQLFEPAYIEEYLRLRKPASDDTINETTGHLATIQKELEKRGIQLVVLITPTKAVFYEEDIPDSYFWRAEARAYETSRGIDRLRAELAETDVQVLDATDLLQSTSLDTPIFPKTGVHWTMPAAFEAAQELNALAAARYNTLEVTSIEYPSSTGAFHGEDLDMLRLLNSFSYTTDELYYTVDYTVGEYFTLQPRVFFQGGSFLNQFRATLDTHSLMKTKQLFYSQFMYMTTENGYPHTFVPQEGEPFESLDLDTILGTSELVVLEVNEEHADRMGVGFLAYLAGYLQANETPRLYEKSYIPGNNHLALYDFTDGVYQEGWAARRAIVQLADPAITAGGLQVEVGIPAEVLALRGSISIYANGIPVVQQEGLQADMAFSIDAASLPKSENDVYDIAIVADVAGTVEDGDGREVAMQIKYVGA